MTDIKVVAADNLERSKQRFLLTLSFVPEDKLSWSPVPSASNTLQIAQHVAEGADWFLPVLGQPKPVHPEGAGPVASTREESVRMLNDAMNRVAAAIKVVPDERLGEMLDLGFMKVPMAGFLMMPSNHLDTHAAQIDYLQSCWGDSEFHY